MLLFSGCIQYQIIASENPDVRNHPRISPRIFAIIRKFWGRVGCEKIDVRWGTIKHISRNKVLPFPIKIGQVEIFTRATPGSSLCRVKIV